MKQTLLAMIAILSSASFAAADGDATAGEKVFRKCAACHSVDGSKKKPGPHLAGILGRPAASVEGFKYSQSLSEAGLVWDTETLTAFLANPRENVPGTKMSFPGIRKEDDLTNLIAYLEGL
ncbi:Cytochrome c2 [Ruegeria sp. THAF57]|uniref:c-type cytochrome n=1 Tax=Ruegeria sp. THAF57 TaxID=2744555 RepID=UPI0015DF18B0|nr:cytochrome c family protein [Ruegeria sp. THAF57]CAD0186999.1 Cytochrome c2 [Ruegeria sp. THAF57]